jgi:hypothetical protein
LQGEVLYAYEYYWNTLGDGTFSDSSLLDAIYTPGPGDIENEQVVLVLTAFEVSPCNGSKNDSLTINILPVSIDDKGRNDVTLRIYPNPVRDIITVQASVPSDDPVSIQVIESNGKVIFNGWFTPINRYFEKQFDLSYLKPGIYFIRLQAGDEVVTRKLVVRME